MSTLQDFETALNEVVQAKRLSQSKMTKLTEIAMELMDRDTQLVSTMYRTHKSLPVACKISSLYIFDALARAARQQVIKHNLSERHSTGNCATFLLKVAGVLEGLFQDMLAAGAPETKEKTKKIYDIWVKGNTFPPNILSRLSDIVTGKNKEPEMNPSVTSDPRTALQTNTTASVQSPTALTPTDPQAALLALLTQAASQQTQTSNTTVSPTTSAGAPHLTLLQYLQTAVVDNAATGQLSPTPQVSDTHVSQTATDPRITKSPHATHAELVYARQGERRDSYRSPPRSDPYHKRDHDDQAPPRNDHRDSFRRRGRWNRWDEPRRDYRRNSNETEWSPSRDGRSRSRSPDGPGRRKNLSPPSINSPRSFPARARYDESGPKSPSVNRDPERDEFGRDLRSLSPSSGPGNHSPITPSTPRDPKAEFSSMSTSNDPMSRSSIAANTSSKEPDVSLTALESNTKTASQAGLDSFNLSTFDPTSPASWETLGKLWETTNGYTPSTEELMQFMMMGVVSQSTNSNNWQQTSAVGSNGPNSHRGGKGAVPRGRGGGYGGLYGNTRNSHSGWAHNHDEVGDQPTDAIVLGGDGIDGDISMTENVTLQSQFADSGTPGGKMQKVGDKWVFVRTNGSS